LKHTKVVVACVSNEYAASEACLKEFLFAKNNLRLPILLAVFGTGDQWRQTEVGMCGLSCPQVNFQLENPMAFDETRSFVQSHLPKPSQLIRENNVANRMSNMGEQRTNAAYQVRPLIHIDRCSASAFV
jgi:hypothetical protein